MKEYDLIVVGSGPAGATAATIVAMKGWKVLLVDKELFPRYQIGESLLPATIHGICRLIGVDDEIHKAGFVRKNGAIFRWGVDKKPWSIGFSSSEILSTVGADYAYQVERSKFDAILLNKAKSLGVEVRAPCKVKNILTEKGRVSGVEVIEANSERKRYKSKFVIDASGHSTAFHEKAGKRHYSNFFRNVAIFTYFQDVKRLPFPNQGNIINEAFDDGWGWFIPLRNEGSTLTSVGMVVDKDYFSKFNSPEECYKTSLKKCSWLSDLLKNSSSSEEDIYKHLRVRKDWSYINDSFWSPGYACIGDSACFIDPVLSTGVHLGTFGALLVARSVNSVLSDSLDEDIVFSEFQERYRNEYAAFYTLLLSFYDMHKDSSSHFWKARKILNTKDGLDEAFVRLASGCATSPEVYFDAREGFTKTLQEYSKKLGLNQSLDDRHSITRSLASEFKASLNDKNNLDSDALSSIMFNTGNKSASDKIKLIASEDGLSWRYE